MKDPTVFGDPDRMASPYYYYGTGDNGGVHYNSGVGNKAAYLITDGDTFNGYTITGIGITKAAKIYYEAQTNILSPIGLWQSLRCPLPGMLQPGRYQWDQFMRDCTQVRNATLATEMDYVPPQPRMTILIPQS